MPISPYSRRNLLRILPFGFFWLIFATSYALMEKGLMGDLTSYPATGNPYSFEDSFVILLPLSFLMGIGVGALEIFYLSKRFLKRGLFQKVLFKTLIYLSLIIFFLLISALITNANELQKNIFHPDVLANIAAFAGNFAFLSITIFVALIIIISLFYNETSENIGYEVLMNFLTGKYHQPIQEERIFMFLDMKSSTTIAERIGHVKYFEMLKKYYHHLSAPVVEYRGEIYQYVGDEVIVSWKRHKGIRDSNCLNCFFAMKDAISRNKEYYQAQFGVVPEFKAGLHLGKVTTGEIGRIKKDIIFTGDVLNTTARIQGLCNMLNTELLVSEQLKQQLPANSRFNFKLLGERDLRGRDQKITLFAVQNHKT